MLQTLQNLPVQWNLRLAVDLPSGGVLSRNLNHYPSYHYSIVQVCRWWSDTNNERRPLAEYMEAAKSLNVSPLFFLFIIALIHDSETSGTVESNGESSTVLG
jgi:hypothetical protein